MEEGSIAVLVDAKEEYTKQLISVLKSCIYQGIKSIYIDAKDICNQDNTPEKVLMVFQDLLSRIPKWSQDIINKEFERIVSISKCDYIEDLLKVIYVSHIKVLTIVHSSQKNKKLSIKVPNGGHFVHLCYIECAREFWKDPYLFSENSNKYELQKNMRDSETMISECIAETIRKQLPVRHILKEFLNEPDEEIEEADDDVREPVNKKYMKKLESVVKKELKTTNKSSTLGSGEIDIELIRKVIREELNTRPQTDVIKKELVETVVEKIVEQANETSIEPTDKIIEEIKDKDNDKDTNVKEKSVVDSTLPPISKSIDIQESIKENGIENGIENVNQQNKDTEIELENTPQKKPKVEISDNIDVDSDNVSANNLESLLNEVEMRTPSKDSKLQNDTRKNDEIALENNKFQNDGVNKNATTNDTMKLQINDVDEINLNLDEIEDEDVIFQDSDLEEIDIKPKSNNQNNNQANTTNTADTANSEIKKNNNKYIFFNE